MNWGANPSGSMRPPYQNTIIKDLPFNDRTIYKDCYNGAPGEKDPNAMRLMDKFGKAKF